MSLMNMLLGRNPAAPYLFGFLGITQQTIGQWPLGRMRDIYTNEEGTKIFIFTRNGISSIGLTEEQRDEIHENFKANHPNYVGFEIDNTDQTYLTYEFNTPEQFLTACKGIAELTETDPPMRRFMRLIKDMDSGKSNPTVEHALEVGKKIFDQIVSGESGDLQHGDGTISIMRLSDVQGGNDEKPKDVDQ